ncbi:hypothetical protein [Candidatus Berkiella aquae]|uniref:Uncharacterized protein n=1 Tax=Candidatus Berkiella aquae TaxID=295108 RepID=A0A0Q9Y8K4_9GAMM|nr:hypothetical protein [Candidatus Berkiella aquae]MCS5710794.1 hypothetical protein [Candidatus Berkiella aquae]
MSYKVTTSSNFTGLTIAEDRFAAFETIRDANDPLMRDRRAPGKPLCDSDYFAALPAENHQLLHQKRLHAIIEQTKRLEAQEQIAAEQHRKQAAKLSF